MTCSNISKWKEIIECVAEKGFCEDEEWMKRDQIGAHWPAGMDTTINFLGFIKGV
jgi:hypothetical protein